MFIHIDECLPLDVVQSPGVEPPKHTVVIYRLPTVSTTHTLEDTHEDERMKATEGDTVGLYYGMVNYGKRPCIFDAPFFLKHSKGLTVHAIIYPITHTHTHSYAWWTHQDPPGPIRTHQDTSGHTPCDRNTTRSASELLSEDGHRKPVTVCV